MFRSTDIDSEFVDELRALVPAIFAPEMLHPKVINGQQISGKQMYDLFKV